MTDLERCVAEQALCADHIRAGGEGQRGARQGAHDWLAEEAIIRMENEEGS